MRILVTASSLHGSTEQIADFIADRLRGAGYEVERIAPDDVQTLDGFDAVIVGSSVRMRQWLKPAQSFTQRFHDQLREMPAWGFSVGMSGVPKRAVQDPRRIGPVGPSMLFREHRTFAGRYQPADLPLRDRTLTKAAGAVEGDFRDWDEIGKWADSIAKSLGAHKAS